MYLSFEDYIGYGYDAITSEEFEQIIKKAERMLNAVTHDFYVIHDLDQDTFKLRVQAFKRALCEQIDFIHAGGGASYEMAQQSYNSVSIGRLSLTPADKISNKTIGGVCREAYTLLVQYGLVYRGVPST